MFTDRNSLCDDWLAIASRRLYQDYTQRYPANTYLKSACEDGLLWILMMHTLAPTISLSLSLSLSQASDLFFIAVRENGRPL